MQGARNTCILENTLKWTRLWCRRYLWLMAFNWSILPYKYVGGYIGPTCQVKRQVCTGSVSRTLVFVHCRLKGWRDWTLSTAISRGEGIGPCPLLSQGVKGLGYVLCRLKEWRDWDNVHCHFKGWRDLDLSTAISRGEGIGLCPLPSQGVKW